MIILDIETTGFSNTDDEILQVSIIDGDNTVLFNEYMKPAHTERWDNAEAVNGISPVMVKDEKPFEFYKEKINEIIKGADLVLGYNVTFDLGFLYENGIERVANDKIVDVMFMFAKYYGDWNEYHCDYIWKKLIFASEHFNYTWEENAHNSLGDVKATLFVYNKLIELQNVKVYYEIGELEFENGNRVAKDGKNIDEWKKAYLYYRNKRSGDKTIIVIKHIGEYKREICIEDYKPSYL